MKRAAILVLSSALGSGAHASVVISNAATSQMDCSDGVCTATAKIATLNVGELETMLAASDVTVNTGAGAVTISVNAPLAWASASRLTLNADQNVSIKRPVVVEGTAGLTIGAGAINFYPRGSIAFWDTTSSLSIAGHDYTLVGNLASLNASVISNPAGFYALANDYDAKGNVFPSDAAVTAPLKGSFEGLGHKVANFTLSANDDSEIGLFKEIDGRAADLSMTGGGIVCDLINSDAVVGMFVARNKGKLRNIKVSGTIDCANAAHVGGVAGDNTASGVLLQAVSSVALIQSNVQIAGGVAGTNAGRITQGSASGSVAGATAGGLVGSTTGSVRESFATGAVSSANGYELGGLAGFASGSIAGCFASGDVGAKSYAGGLVGYASSAVIDSSFATGTATGGRAAGGLIGGAGAKAGIVDSYARGDAEATNAKLGAAGGLVGTFSNGDTIGTSYSTGKAGGGRNNGGLIGAVSFSALLSDAYWDLDTSGIADPAKGIGNIADYPGATGLTTAQLQSQVPTGFDPSVWAGRAGINDGLPYLIANPPQ